MLIELVIPLCISSANQLNKGFNASVRTMNCGRVMR